MDLSPEEKRKVLEDALTASRAPQGRSLEDIQGDVALSKVFDTAMQGAANARAAGYGAQAANYGDITSAGPKAELAAYLEQAKADRELQKDLQNSYAKSLIPGKTPNPTESGFLTKEGHLPVFLTAEGYKYRDPVTGEEKAAGEVIRPAREGGININMAGMKPLSDTAVKDIADMANIESLSGQLIQEVPTLNTGYFSTHMREANQKFNPFYEATPEDLKATEQATRVENMLAGIRHKLYGSNVTAGEAANLERMLPNSNDKPEVFASKLKSFNEAFAQQKENYINAQKAAGRNTTGVEKAFPAQIPVAPTKPNTPALSGEDQQAFDWAKANPNDPRSATILKSLGK